MKKWRGHIGQPPVRKRRLLSSGESVFQPETIFTDRVVYRAYLFSSYPDGIVLFAGKRRSQASRVLWPSTFLNPGELVDRCFYPDREWGSEGGADSTSWTDEGTC